MREIGGNNAEAHDGGLGRDRTLHVGLHLGCFHYYKYVDSVHGCLLHQSCCFWLSDFVFTDCKQTMESSALLAQT